MPRGQIHINLPPDHPIMSFETIEIKMAAVSVKRSIRSGSDAVFHISRIEFIELISCEVRRLNQFRTTGLIRIG